MKSTLLIIISSFSFDDNIGQTFAIYIITIAGAESVIGLSILVAYYRSKMVWTLFNNLIRVKKNFFLIFILQIFFTKGWVVY